MAFLDETGLAELWALTKAEDEAHDRYELALEVAVSKTQSSSNISATALVSNAEFNAIMAAGYDELYIYYKGTITTTATVSDTAGYGSIADYQTNVVSTNRKLFEANANPGSPVTKEFDECVVYHKGAAGKWYTMSGSTNNVEGISTARTIGVMAVSGRAVFEGTLRIYGRRVVK